MKTTAGVLLFLSLFGLSSGLRVHNFVKSTKTWEEAQTYCRNNYDDLSTASGSTLHKLSNVSISNNLFSYWIGLQTDTTLHIWKWSAGGKATIHDWYYSSEPATDYERCGYVMAVYNKVDQISCLQSYAFFCMEDYELILVKQERTWEEALDYCRQNYIDLAILKSDVRMEEARINSTDAQTDELWMGLRFLSGNWMWANGEELHYEAWSEGQELQCPAMNQRCGVYDRQEMVWKPADCGKRLNFLCHYKA